MSTLELCKSSQIGNEAENLKISIFVEALMT